jgi:hypothetical protein
MEVGRGRRGLRVRGVREREWSREWEGVRRGVQFFKSCVGGEVS